MAMGAEIMRTQKENFLDWILKIYTLILVHIHMDFKV